jgi:hypothetical protein
VSSKGQRGYFVYFIAAASGPIKIGRAKNVRTRLGALQVGNHERLSCLGTIPPSWFCEEAVHAKFAYLNIHGEWFRPEPELLSFINDLAFDIDGEKRVTEI